MKTKFQLREEVWIKFAGSYSLNKGEIIGIQYNLIEVLYNCKTDPNAWSVGEQWIKEKNIYTIKDYTKYRIEEINQKIKELEKEKNELLCQGSSDSPK